MTKEKTHRELCKNWLWVTAFVIGAAGPVFTLATIPVFDAPGSFTLDILAWPLDGGQSYQDGDIRFLSDLSGGFLIGWAAMIVALRAWVFDAAPEGTRRAVLAGVFAWYVVDSLGSTLAGHPINAAFNLIALVAAIGPLHKKLTRRPDSFFPTMRPQLSKNLMMLLDPKETHDFRLAGMVLPLERHLTARKLLVVSYVLLAFCSVGWAATYYVSPSGNDSNDGLTPQAAFRTIQHAANAAVRPGDVVLVANGAYDAFTITHSGNPGAFIRFTAMNTRGAKVTGQDWQDAITIAADFIEVDGFEVTAGLHGINGESRHHLKIVNNHAHNCGKSGISLGHNPTEE